MKQTRDIKPLGLAATTVVAQAANVVVACQASSAIAGRGAARTLGAACWTAATTIDIGLVTIFEAVIAGRCGADQIAAASTLTVVGRGAGLAIDTWRTVLAAAVNIGFAAVPLAVLTNRR